MKANKAQRHRGRSWTQMNAATIRQTAGFSKNRNLKDGVAQLQPAFCFYFLSSSGWICVHLRNLRPMLLQFLRVSVAIHIS